ncbi:hypothetical protein Q7689_26395, partial [Nocardiopsis tropica]|nr:hypothetical protein [Nocardiopsis tropica]
MLGAVGQPLPHHGVHQGAHLGGHPLPQPPAGQADLQGGVPGVPDETGQIAVAGPGLGRLRV